MEENIRVTTTKLEKIFPCGFFDVMEHHPIHLVQEARLGGPEDGCIYLRVKEVALGPESQVLTMNKYCVNGFKFQTEEVSRNKKTNNSGVYIQGDVDGTGQTIEYYGVIQEIIEVRYSSWPKKKIVLFRDKSDWWVVIKSKHVGRINIDNVLDVAY
ncbi:hypothetical protein RDI58_014917 [Solanum bulbocastanum]|uniref:DUF4218 domain-containing protein n=1 Tax=Solanum bulbocastanum TaxID=147425 RepID=A0AAN8TJI5_SOLBU